MLTATLTMDDDGTVASSLGPESERSLPRTGVHIDNTNGVTTMTINASDVSAMRAALNSYLGFIRIVEDIGKITRR